MKLLGVLPFARSLLTAAVGPGDTVVDATAGNGHDTLFLADLVGHAGTVISCDIQKEAIEATQKRLNEAGHVSNIHLHQLGHERLTEITRFNESPIAAAIFNLGYLPKGDKTVTTKGETTIAAIKQLFAQLKPEGLIVLVIYHGHPEGKLEKDDVLSFIQSLPQEEAHVATYGFINQRNDPPFVAAIEKRLVKGRA